MPSPPSPTPAPPVPADARPAINRRRWELGTFLAVVMVIIPGLTVAAIGSYALVVWVLQMFVYGPPGPLDH